MGDIPFQSFGDLLPYTSNGGILPYLIVIYPLKQKIAAETPLCIIAHHQAGPMEQGY